MLKFESVSKVYKVGTFGGKELRAVNNVSFDIKDCEVVSLIGESGSGKSTIGKMILRLISITSGNIIFDGDNITSLKNESLKEYYRKVQGVFQDPFSSYNPIFKADRVFSIIRDEFYPQMANQEWNKKVDNSLSTVGLNPDIVLNKYPHQLSGGQLQRLLIARALLLDIQFLVADEIISMLDASTRIDVLNLLADLKTKGLSILFITHDLSLSYYISERAVILYRGNVVEMGATENIFYHSLHPYTKMLMVSVPRLDMKWQKSIEIPKDQGNPPGSCPYFDRCDATEKTELCAKNPPPLVQVDDDHYVACFGYKP